MKDEALRPREKAKSKQKDKDSKGANVKKKRDKDKGKQKSRRDKSHKDRQSLILDDNQSELSYQHPDTDMSLAKTRAGKSTSTCKPSGFSRARDHLGSWGNGCTSV